MDIEELKDHISTYAVRIIEERGIKTLFPPQVEAVKAGLFTRKNMVIAIPTASGKTLLAELAMVREIIEGGKCLYVVPLRALAMEKYEEFRKWEKIGAKVGMSIGDYESRDEWLSENDIVVTTSEKADSLMRNRAGWLKDVTCLVVDEVHLLDSAKRGATLEILMAKMRKVCNPRIIALSATIPNADEIAAWLDAVCVKSDWRPVPLFEGIFFNGRLEFYADGVLTEQRKIGKDIMALVLDCLEQGGQVLVFDSTRRNAESTALKLAQRVFRYIDSNEDIAKAVLEENEGEMSQRLADCIRMGTAFHHAGLLNSQRTAVEKAFREGRVKVVVATPTLAAGVNLPARRVIIKSYHRFGGYASEPIKTIEYKQMVGRAGRPGLDERGEAVVIVRSNRSREEVLNRYIFGEVERITSKLGAENHLRFHTLALSSDFRSIDALENFFESTFFFHQNEISARYELERILLQLERWEMLEFGENSISVTELGDMVSRLYIDPLTGFMFYSELSKRDEFTEIAALHLICRTPDMENLYIKKSDDWVEEEAIAFMDELTYAPSPYSADYDWFLAEVKTAMCLHEWINESDEDEICEKYGIAPGDLMRVVETAEWLAYALSKIAAFINHAQKSFFSGLVKRIKYGVKEELLDLVEIKGIGRARARKLYTAGIRNRRELVENRQKAAVVIGKRVAEKAIAQIENDLKRGG
ncbi:DEAD/DEAH box helicase [Archaeoglobus veneficus]|uniref:ATP-dependent DNA helicase Hel308 n=1 Tax=Archaeoglobus veneficus (strain DSM 11195 / SNP6) TaxID=693661 RepID=F2KRA3_ARCVS|nr:DEAD/DEAH box helicase [Archaeoglobus veneficus]AEA47837.1 ski2-type helicase [Archaeoglobus veneficus SNP6]